jgi:hypothetical protein
MVANRSLHAAVCKPCSRTRHLQQGRVGHAQSSILVRYSAEPNTIIYLCCTLPIKGGRWRKRLLMPQIAIPPRPFT